MIKYFDKAKPQKLFAPAISIFVVSFFFITLLYLYNDVLNSDLVILGSDLKEGHKFLLNFYKKIYKKNLYKLRMLKLKEAEVSKIAINSYITMKISFSNLISSISDKENNLDSSVILNTIGFDKRIGHKYYHWALCLRAHAFLEII